ncbi:MAG: acetate--CoA ligase family protein [Deltaproteobacteria bacterium]|nr:acetate--CoA ligase family protein [Deltaproteobacteria bacterium]
MNSVTRIFEETFATDHRIVTEDLSKAILKKYGVKVPIHRLVTTETEAVKAAETLGFPLVMKIVSPQILHKTDVGGVRAGLQNEAEVRQVFRGMYPRLSGKKGVHVKGVLLERMVPPGIELIVGLQNDPQFGPVIMVGLGGVLTEILKDVAFRMLPITADDAKAMLAELKGARILSGYRGSKPVDLNMLATALVQIGRIGMDNANYFENVDFNPLIVYPKSYTVVDAKILLKKEIGQHAVSTVEPDIDFMETFFTPRTVAVPPTYAIGNGNPTDVTGGANADDYRYAIQKFIDDPNVDIVTPSFVFQDDPLDEAIVEYLGDFARKGVKPLLVGANGGPCTARMSALIERHHVPVYDDIRNWIAAASVLYHWGKQMSRKV